MPGELPDVRRRPISSTFTQSYLRQAHPDPQQVGVSPSANLLFVDFVKLRLDLAETID